MRAAGLRTHMSLLVLAAVLPLAILGLYLTRSAANAGAVLLEDHLRVSADGFVGAIEKRWEYRSSDLLLLAGNTAALHVVEGAASPADTAYLNALLDDLSTTTANAELQSAAGETLWSASPEGTIPTSPSQAPASPVWNVRLPVHDSAGRLAGLLIASIYVSAVIPSDSTRPLVPGIRIAVTDRATERSLVSLGVGLRVEDDGRAHDGAGEWLVTRRSITAPALDIMLAAPLAPYAGRFETIARIGTVALAAALAVAMLCAAALTHAVVTPLRRLADAADTVTRGGYGHTVTAQGPAEIRRVGQAFNYMSASLRDTLDRLSRRGATEAVGEFATELSHDIRNALTSIKVDLERSLRRTGTTTENDLVERALRNVTKLETAVDGALRVARQGTAEPQSVDLRWPVQGAINTTMGSFAAIPATLKVHLPGAPVLVRGDPRALEQLVANILFNAAQALPAEGVAHIAVSTQQDEAVVTISDNGPGIGAAVRPDGNGVGLAIARRIAAQHSGHFHIDSAAGRGTMVTVRLPQH